MTEESPMRLVIDCDTNTSTLVPLTEEEIADAQKRQAEFEAEQAKIEEKAKALADAKASALAKLANLGLTEEEAKAIFS